MKQHTDDTEIRIIRVPPVGFNHERRHYWYRLGYYEQ
jgi:hypothetical protein